MNAKIWRRSRIGQPLEPDGRLWSIAERGMTAQVIRKQVEAGKIALPVTVWTGIGPDEKGRPDQYFIVADRRVEKWAEVEIPFAEFDPEAGH